jgi:hypothetical protein
MTTMLPDPRIPLLPVGPVAPATPAASFSAEGPAPNGQAVVWLRKPGAKKRQTTLVHGGCIQQAWLQQRLRVTQVRFQGPLAQALTDLQQATKKSQEKNLPIVRLRAALMSNLEGVLRLDRDLGLREAGKPAFEIRHEGAQEGDADDEQDTRVRDVVVGVLKRWNLDVLLAWAERNDVGDIAYRVGAAINADSLSIVHVSLPLAETTPDGAVRKTQFDLVARQISERLIGEELFDGLGPCDIVADPSSKSGVVELMTAPTKLAGSDIVFSMVAHLSVFTLPYSPETYLRVSAIKRVWASRVPGRKPNAPPTVKCYIVAPNKPILLARARCPAKEWEFDDDYLQYLVESKGKLPATLAEAVVRTMPDDSGWWFGLPKLTTLFDKVGGRTVFEGDESDLHEKVMALLPDVVHAEVAHREVKLGRQAPSSGVAMLKLGDLGLAPESMITGLAGAALLDSDEGEGATIDDVGDSLTVDQKRALRIERHRKANILALGQVHPNQTPVLWVFGASERERVLIGACMTELFGDSVKPMFEVLPDGVHGLRDGLDVPKGKGAERFDARLKHWEPTAKQIPRNDGPRYVLICAPKEINGRSEDPVNYYAGLHAMCSMADANVHHILPIETDRKSQKPDEQNFVHRLQSALLDVFMAHSGIVLGTQAFAASRLPRPLPHAIYGIQVVRSRAKNFTSESSVSFLLFTRLVVASGTTEVQFSYRTGNRTVRKAWVPLNEGLRWLGSQRQISSDDVWVKENFAGQVRSVLGELAQSDPRAVILIDWSTVGGLWHGINDSNLVAGGTPRVMLDSANLATACPEMTFVRLRSNRDATMSLRKRSAMLYEAWKNEPALAPTGDVVEETYTTTLKSIVEINASDAEGGTAKAGVGPHHYLMVMGYRKTVQILRGMSCYRTRRRMKPLDTDGKDDKEGKRFDWETVSPSKDDAALPASLEVTVLACPNDAVPDDIARLVMGLRLGYAHYDEWTASPAPLFFAAKVQDYIIRYPDHAPEAPEPDDTDPSHDDDGSTKTRLIDTYLGDVQKALLGEAAAGTDSFTDAIEGTPTIQREMSQTATTVLDASRQDSAVAVPDEGEELKPSDPLLARAWDSARAVTKLYLRRSGPVCRRLYEDMLFGNVRVIVDLPWFVTRKTVVPESAWPDSRAIKRFWQTQGDLGFRKPKGTAPSTAGFPEWLTNRLRTPQSLYAVDTAGLFPANSRVFYRSTEFFLEYVAEFEKEGKTFPQIEAVTRKDCESMARWMVENGSDENIAWTLVMLAHYPLRVQAETLLMAMCAKSLGPMSLAALQFFTDCNEAVIQALELRRKGIKKIPEVVRRAMLAPEIPLGAMSQRSQTELGTLGASDPPATLGTGGSKVVSPAPIHAFVVAPTHSRDHVHTPPTKPEPPMPRHAVVQAISSLKGGPTNPTFAAVTRPAEASGATGAQGEHALLLRLAASLRPGQADFAKVRESIDEELDRLTTLHSEKLQAIHDARQQELFREQLIDRLSQIVVRARNALERITPECLPPSSGTFAVVTPAEVPTSADDASLVAFEATIGDIEVAVDMALQALTCIEDVESARVSELQGLAGMDRTRRKSALMISAIAELDEAQKRLHDRLCACPIICRSLPLVDPSEDVVPENSATVPQSHESTTANISAPMPALGPVQVAAQHAPLFTAAPKALVEEAEDREATERGASSSAEAVVEGPAPSSTDAPGEAAAQTKGQADEPPATGLAPVDVVGSAVMTGEVPVEVSRLSQPADSIHPLDPESEAKSDEALVEDLDIDVDTEAEVLNSQAVLTTLARTVQARHWALSQAILQGLQALIPGEAVAIHTITWSSMLRVLSGFSSRAAFEPRLSPALQAYLNGGTAESSLASQSAPCSALASTIGIVGAGLFAMLFEGHEGAARWSILIQAKPRLSEHKPLLDLVERLASLNSTSLMLSRETMSAVRVGVTESLNAEVMRQRERAANWPSDASIYTHWTASDYVEMHRAMFDDRHGLVLGKCLGFIARGADEPARKLLPEVRKYVEKLAGTLGDLRKRTGRRRAFEGPARDYLATNLEVTVKFIEDFFKLVDRSQRESNLDLPKNLVDFLIHLYKDLQAALDYVQDLSFSHTVEQIHRDLTAEVLAAALRMMDDEPHPTALTDEEQLLLLQLPLDAEFHPSLAVRLDADDDASTPLIDPWAIFPEVDAIEDELAERQATSGSKALTELLERAAQGHRDNGRLLPARAIELRLPKSIAGSVHITNEAAQRKQRSQFADDLTDARQRTMNAMSLGALAEVEASRMLKAIEALTRANVAQEIGSISALPTPYTDYPHARALLRHHVLEPLAGRIQQSRERLEGDINSFSEKAAKENPDPQTHARLLEKIQRIRQMLPDGSPSGIRVAHNAFALLREDRLPLLRLEEVNTAHAYEEFQAALKASGAGHRPFEHLAELLRKPSSPVDMEWVSRLSTEQREDAAAFIGNWISLCAARQVTELDAPLAAFFSGLGTAEAPTPMHGPSHAGRLAFFLPTKTFLGSDRSGNGMFIPPSLGSAANHLQGFVLKHQPSTEAFGQVITECAQSIPTFVLARTSLSLAKRSAISRDHPVILIDDDLVAYLAVHPDERVSKLMEIGLLTFNNNPYDDYGGRPVPPEMFFGRKAELKLLRGVKSAAVLYGGRRLGKSSLLDQIQNDSRQQLEMSGAHGQGEMAIYIPLETRLDTASFGENHRLFAWRTIYNGLVKAKFIGGAKGDLNSPEAIRDWISSEVVSGRAATNACYLLIDEADEVMREDLNGDALFITGLQALCDQVRTHCQMRYVIAGLHNLTRMTTDGNSVLGKAESIALQPFSTDVDILNGIELITRPLGALGFDFPKGSENLPLRIMALCNFYPAFIQLYCKNLVTRLYNKRGTAAPPTVVEAADLDAVERDDEFLREIQKKFELNLDLDKRYKAIALILADVYYENSGHGVSLGLTTTEIRDHCQTYTPEHFRQTNGAAYEALVEEMEKLTVLERNGNRFRLRTPHIATMLGTRDRVLRKIEELATEKPTENRIPGESRLIIRQDRHEKVFPMPSAWVRSLLRGADTDLIVWVGNQLSGLYTIDKIQKEWELGQDAVYEVKVFSSPDNARTHLQRARRLTDHAPTRRLVALPPRSWRSADVNGYAVLAGSLSSKAASPDPTQRQRLATIRLALIASPDLAWELAQHLFGPNSTGSPPPKGWRIEPVPIWGDDAVYYRFEQNQNVSVRDSGPARQALLNATCGFGGELDRLCTGGLSVESALKCEEEAQRLLAPNVATFYGNVGLPQAFVPTNLREIEQLLLLIDGERRSDDGVEEAIRTSSVGKAEFEFFQWMGLLQVQPDGTWHVPALYKRLIG